MRIKRACKVFALLFAIIMALAIVPLSANTTFATEGGEYRTLSLEASPADGGIVKFDDDATSGTFQQSSIQNIYAVPNPGYKFVGWYKGNELIAEFSDSTYKVIEDSTLIGKFEKIHDFIVQLTLPEAPGSILDLSSIVAPTGVEYEVHSIYSLNVNGSDAYLDSTYGAALLPGDIVEIMIHVNLVSNENFQYIVPVKVNGNDATEVGIRGGNLEVTYGFTVANTPIELTLPETPGSTLNASAITVPTGAFYCVDSIYTLKVNGSEGIISGQYGATLLPGDEVTITISVKLTSEGAFNKAVPAKVNGNDATEVGIRGGNLEVTYGFTVANTPIELTLPETPGSTLNASAITVPTGAFYCVDSIYTLKVNGSEGIISGQYGATLLPGDEVTITISVKLTSEGAFNKAVPAKVNGNDATEVGIRGSNLEVTYSFKIPEELIFVDSDSFDFDEDIVGAIIDQIDVSSAVSGGVSPYTFSKVSGPAWISVSTDGEISGTRPVSAEAASELVVKVIDSTSAEKSILIIVGATVVPTKEDTPSAATFTAMGENTGKLTGVDTGMVYRVDSGNEVHISGTSVELEGLEACTIYVIKKATGPTKLDSDPKVTPAATFTATGDSTGILSDVSPDMIYRFGTESWSSIVGDAVNLSDLVPTTISIVSTASGAALQSAPQIIKISRANIPSEITVEKCVAPTNDDGKLKGVSTAMEYRLSTDDSWAAGTGSDITVPAGTYYVRVKASGTVLASEGVIATVNEYDAVQLTGTVSITGNTIFGEVLGVDVADTNNTGVLSYRWVREGGMVVGSSNEYVLVKEDIGKTITLFVSSSKQTGEINQSTGVVSKAPRSDIPVGLDVVKTTHGQSEGRISGVDDSMEYRLSTEDTWTAIGGTEVIGLAAGIYHVRFAMNDTHLASSAHATVTISEFTYSVSFDLHGYGDDISSINDVAYESKVTKPVDPSETGYAFGGWFKETTCENAWDFDTDVVTSNVTLYAKWTVNEYTVIFDSAGGTSVESIIQDYGTAIVPPADPTRAGYRFDGWAPTIPDTIPAENVTCVAQWTELYTVSFDANGGTGSMEVEKTIGDYTLPVNGFTAPVEMEFKCWSVGGAEKNVGDVIEVTAPVTVVAVWKVIVHDEPPYVPSTEGEVTINTVEMTEGQTTTVTEVFEDSKADNKKVVLEIDDMNIEFDAAAVSAIGGNAVTLCAAIETEGHGIDGALKVIRVTLVGAVFPDGKATVSIPFTDTVPEGKVVKVYHIDGGDRRDMNAVLSGGVLTYETNHFSDFAVFIEDVPAPNDDDDGGFPVWAIVLIVVAVIAVAGGVGGYILLQKKKV